MRKLLRFMLISFVLISILFLSSCRYKMFWDKKDIEIGSIENYVISEDKNGEYYISEPIVENDAKGVGPLIMAYTEVMKIQD